MNINEFEKVIRSSSGDWSVVLNIQTDSRGNDLVRVWAKDLNSGITIDLTDFSQHSDPRIVAKALDNQNIKYTPRAISGIKNVPALLVKYGFQSGDQPEQPAEQPTQTIKRCSICKKSGFKRPTNCLNFAEQGRHWQCQLNADFVGSAPVSPLVWQNGRLA
jgi:hypothetical protein